jgi:hypothetical protein
MTTEPEDGLGLDEGDDGADEDDDGNTERSTEDDTKAAERSSDLMPVTTETPMRSSDLMPVTLEQRAGPVKLNKHQVGVSICRI